MELEGEFQPEASRILDMRGIMLKNIAITYVKVQWKHFELDEVTWDLEDVIKEAHLFLFRFGNELVVD